MQRTDKSAIATEVGLLNHALDLCLRDQFLWQFSVSIDHSRLDPPHLGRLFLALPQPTVEAFAHHPVVTLGPRRVRPGLDCRDHPSYFVTAGRIEIEFENPREFQQVIDGLDDLPGADALALSSGE